MASPGQNQCVDLDHCVQSITSFPLKPPDSRPQQAVSDRSDPHEGIKVNLKADTDRVQSNIIPKTDRHAFRQRFTRPESADESITPGFTFGRPERPKINMTRNYGPVLTAGSTQNANPMVETDIEVQSKPLDGNPDGLSSVIEPLRSPVTAGKIAINGPEARALTHDDESVISPPHILHPTATEVTVSPTTKDVDGVTAWDTNTMDQQVVTEQHQIESINEEYAQYASLQSRKLPGSPESRPIQRPMSRSKLRTPSEARSPTSVRSKVSKPRRKTTQPSTSTDLAAAAQTSATSARASPIPMPTQEDLLGVLAARYKHDKQVRNQERIAHATVVQDLRDISDSLWEQLQAERSRGRHLGDTLSRYEAKMPAWNTKIKKLSDFVQGLTNDHHGLRDKAREIQEDQAKLRHVKTQINTDLDDINLSLSDITLQSNDALNKAKLDMHLLLQQSQNQEAQLHDKAQLLNGEREINRSHSTAIARLISSHHDLTEHLTAQEETQSAKLSTLLEKLAEAPTHDDRGSVEELKAFIQQRLSTALEAFRNVDALKAEDVQRLDAKIEGYAGKIAETMRSCQQDVKTLEQTSQESASRMQQELNIMNTNIKTEQSLTNELTKQCKAKEALEERVQATQIALEDSRKEVAAMQGVKSQLEQQIAGLSAEAASLRDQPRESPATLKRLEQIDSQNKAVKGQLDGLQQITVDASKILQERLEDYAANLQLGLEQAESQLRQEHENAAVQAKELVFSTERTQAKHEEDKKQIRVHADFERNAMDARHRIEINELKHKINVLDKRTSKEVESSKELRIDKQSSEQAVIQQIAVIAQLQKEKDTVCATAEERLGVVKQARTENEGIQRIAMDRLLKIEELQAELDEERSIVAKHESAKSRLDTQFEEQDSRLARLQQSVIRAIAESKSNNGRIHDLEAANAQLVSRSHDAEDARLLAVDALCMVEAREREEASKAKIAIQGLETYKAANPPCKHEEFKLHPQGRSELRRKAQRSDRAEPLDPRSQRSSKLSSISPTTPQRLATFYDSQPNDDNESIGDIADLFPPTPELSSQAVRPSVKFVADSMGSTVLGSCQNSQLRDHLAPDYLPSDYETLSQDEDTQSMSQWNLKRFAPPIHATTRGVPHQGLTNDSRSLPDSQPNSQRSPPKSILKSKKRTAETAGLPVSARDSHRRSLHSESQGLGPVIQDSQSQINNASQTRTQRSSRSRSDKAKTDKFSLRFSQELSKDGS